MKKDELTALVDGVEWCWDYLLHHEFIKEDTENGGAQIQAKFKKLKKYQLP